jgi:hypothetical protein
LPISEMFADMMQFSCSLLIFDMPDRHLLLVVTAFGEFRAAARAMICPPLVLFVSRVDDVQD